jgi:hypothetical protein
MTLKRTGRISKINDGAESVLLALTLGTVLPDLAVRPGAGGAARCQIETPS